MIKQKYGDCKKKNSMVVRDGEGRNKQAEHRGLLSSETVFCMILKWWTPVIIHLSKSTQQTILKGNCNTNYGFGVKMIYVRVGSSIITNQPCWFGALIVGKDRCNEGAGNIGKLCPFHSILL